MQNCYGLFYPGFERPNQQPLQSPYFENDAMPVSPISPSIQTPTGYPSGPVYSQFPVPSSFPVSQQSMVQNGNDPAADTVMSIEYTQGYLRTQIGRKVKVEFLIGTSMLVDREGTLVDVGTSYIIIQETETDDLLLCDMYSIKFVRFYY